MMIYEQAIFDNNIWAKSMEVLHSEVLYFESMWRSKHS